MFAMFAVAGREDVMFPPRQSVPSQQFSPLPGTAAPPIVSFSPITSFVLSATAFGMEEGNHVFCFDLVCVPLSLPMTEEDSFSIFECYKVFTSKICI